MGPISFRILPPQNLFVFHFSVPLKCRCCLYSDWARMDDCLSGGHKIRIQVHDFDLHSFFHSPFCFPCREKNAFSSRVVHNLRWSSISNETHINLEKKTATTKSRIVNCSFRQQNPLIRVDARAAAYLYPSLSLIHTGSEPTEDAEKLKRIHKFQSFPLLRGWDFLSGYSSSSAFFLQR